MKILSPASVGLFFVTPFFVISTKEKSHKQIQHPKHNPCKSVQSVLKIPIVIPAKAGTHSIHQVECRTLEVGSRTLKVGYGTLKVGCRALEVGCRTLTVGCPPR